MNKRRSDQNVGTHATKQRQPPAQSPFQAQLQRLLDQQKYRQALDEIKKAQRHNPAIEFTPSEAEIWSMRGQQEFQKNDLKQAEASFKRALELGLNGAGHYWLARTLLTQDRLDAALEVIQTAFDQGTLPKDYAVCYLKLLLLKGETATVEQLISKQAKRFSAAQLHWARGVLALKAEQPDAALTSLQKIKRPLTPGDNPDAWVAYTQQQLENWSAASAVLGMRSTSVFGFALVEPKYLKSPVLRRLALVQQAKTGEPPLTPSDLRQAEPATQEAVTALSILQLIGREDYHNAAHALLNLNRRPTHLPQLLTLRPALLTLAGQQALQGGEPQCAEAFWKPLLAEQFNPQLAVNLLQALEQNDSDQERQRLVTRLIKWVEQDAKKNPQAWPTDRLKLTLANLHCRLADSWMALERYRAAMGAVQQAERIDPTSPEVIGRKGLMVAAEGDTEAAIKLLTQALEQGCQYEEVYGTLLSCWDELKNSQAKLEARRKFGKSFGDSNPELEVAFAPWLDALYTQSYPFFSRLVQVDENPDPPLRACQLFVEAVQSPPNSGGRVSLNQSKAKSAWDALLNGLSATERVPTLQAIALSLCLFAKREKGIAALTSQYTQQLFELSGEVPEAREAHLVVLAVKESNPKKLESPIRFYLDGMPQPGNALAQIQLQVRKFGWIRNLIPFLEEALQREPQNPLLLLARATTYPLSMPQYEELKQQGFEIARRVQDAKALQAFREEQAFLNLREAQTILPDPDAIGDLDADSMMDIMEAMIRQMFGQQIPKSEIDRMLPELKQQMLNDLPDLGDDDGADDEFYIDPPIRFEKSKRRRQGFRNL